MRKNWLPGLVALALLALATTGLAQPRKGIPRNGRRPPSAAPAPNDRGDAPYEEVKPAVARDPEPQAATLDRDRPRSPVPPPADAGSPRAAPVPPGAPAQAPLAARDAGAVHADTKLSPLNPPAEELSDGAPPPQVPALRPELDQLLGDIAALRARVAAVSDTLFQSRIVVRLETRGDHARVGRLVVTLDEGTIYAAKPGFHADDEVTLYEHAVAPGRHQLGIEVERLDERNEAFRDAQKSSFTLEVPDRQTLETVVRVTDDSDMGGEFPSGKKGEYDLRVRVRARTAR